MIGLLYASAPANESQKTTEHGNATITSTIYATGVVSTTARAVAPTGEAAQTAASNKSATGDYAIVAIVLIIIAIAIYAAAVKRIRVRKRQ